MMLYHVPVSDTRQVENEMHTVPFENKHRDGLLTEVDFLSINQAEESQASSTSSEAINCGCLQTETRILHDDNETASDIPSCYFINCCQDQRPASITDMNTSGEIYKTSSSAMTFEQKLNHGRKIDQKSNRDEDMNARRVHEGRYSLDFFCPECDRAFTDSHHLYEHLDSSHTQVHDVDQYTCNICARSFAFMYRLRRHMLSHSGEKPYHCKQCSKSFTTNAYLRSHVARHSSDWTYLCSDCGKRFADVVAWRTHKRCHENRSLSGKEHICWVCGLKLSSASNLTKHVQRHVDAVEKPHICHVCNRQFATKEGLQYHVSSHAAEKPFQCKQCPRAFVDAFSLKTHVKFHARNGSFVCGECGKKYKTSNYLKEHAKGHAIKKYSCEICGETFGFARQLRTHVVKHKPPYKCEKCGVTCKRANGLLKHQKRFRH